MANKNRFLFVKILNSLLESDIALSKALCIIQKMKSAKKAVRKAAEEIELYLQQGSLLSVALQKCSAIEFNSIYGAFVSCAQSGGSIKKIFTFLYLREYGLRQKKQKLIYSIIYPVFVTLVAMTGCILLMTFGKNIIPNISGKFDFDLYKQNAVKGCISANLFLVACVIAFCLAIKNLFSREEYVDSFKILNFLTASGVDKSRSFILVTQAPYAVAYGILVHQVYPGISGIEIISAASAGIAGSELGYKYRQSAVYGILHGLP